MIRVVFSSLVFLWIGNVTFGQSIGKKPSNKTTVLHSVSISIPEVSLVDVIGPKTMFSFHTPLEAGEPLETELVDSSAWINYSVVKSSKHKSLKNVYVRFEQNMLPRGLRLEIKANPYSGQGKGQHGTSTGRIEVTTNQHILIRDIATCYTGTGLYSGHQLVYYLSVDQTQYDPTYTKC